MRESCMLGSFGATEPTKVIIGAERHPQGTVDFVLVICGAEGRSAAVVERF